jgi:hypothetical protein
VIDRQRPARLAAQVKAYYETPLDHILGRCGRQDPAAVALALFHDAATAVPAYRAFLVEHGVDPADVALALRTTACRVPALRDNQILHS